MSIVAAELHHLVDRQAADPGHARRGVLVQHALSERFVAEGVALDVVAVDEVLADQYVHHAEREGRVGARTQRHVLRAFFSR
jgi:hypothetical protein